MKALSDERREEVLRQNREDYIWRKEHGICTRCKKERAFPGHIMCPDCMYKANEYAIQWHKDHQKEHCEQVSKCNKNRYYKRKAAGLCVSCGKRAPVTDRVMCVECMQRYKRKKTGGNRQYWVEHGLCFCCGKPVVPGKKMCKEHYEKRVAHTAAMREKKALLALEKEEKSGRLSEGSNADR